ncbi:MAG TPA: ABC transporter ATP-binding protein [Flexilinea sp.]|nr:ABC transporter ATP-binding protein [Flexilinea sp.]
MSDAINVKNISKIYPGFELKDISFNLPKGYIMGFIGPNGAGKTTTIKLILNMIQRAGGTIEVFGLDNIAYDAEIKEHTGVVFDNHYFLDEWTLNDINRVMALFFSNWQSSIYREKLEQYQLNPAKKVKELSKGMRLKLMLAVAFSHDAKLLILDEPTSGLDPVARDELLETLAKFIQDGERSVLFSTHITSDLEKIADYITFINNGRLIFTGIKDEFIDSFRLVKGGKEDLTPDVKAHLIGYREYDSGFEGIMYTEYATLFPNLLAEKSSIDNIIVFTYKGTNGL